MARRGVLGWVVIVCSIAPVLTFAVIVSCARDETVPLDDAVARVRAHPIPPEQAHGRSLYAAACAPCHGEHGEGSDRGPPMLHPLQARMHGDAAFERAVREGVKPHHYQLGTMPSVDDLEPGDVDAIILYVRWMQGVAGLR